MQVRLFKVDKRPNSTWTPVITNGKAIDVQLKDETSFLNPVLIIGKNPLSGVFSPSAFNYVLIPYWERYYYITDWTYINGAWELSCNVDVLASFKYNIGDTTSYIIRSASSYDGNIIDSFYPATTQASITKIGISSEIYHTSLPSGCYVLGCISNDTSNKIGSVTYYALSANELAGVLSYLFSSNIYNDSNIAEIGEGLYKSLFNPFQYIVSCMWFPFPASALGDSTGAVKVGYWSTGVTGTLARYVVKEIGFKSNLPIPQHPQSNRGEYLNHAPYTRVTAYYPPFGEIPVDTMYMQYGNNNYLYGKMFVDFVTGVSDCYFSITNGYGDYADPYKFFCMRTAQIGVPIQICQVMSDYVSSLTSAVGAVSSGFAGSISGIFTGLANAVQSAMPKVSSLGANGSLVEIAVPPYMIVEHYRLVSENNTEFGRPLCANKKINTLSGYILCGEADHSFPCTKTESDMINQFMRNGFYYE